MMTAFTVLLGLIALLHVYIFLLETVLFKTRGRKVFGLSKEHAELVAPLMSNQGCYNAFLAAALALGIIHPDPAIARAFAFFGLTCVAVAGVWGAATAKKSILFIQTLPAVIALAVGYLA
jgi:putative membrane protein